MLTDLNQIFKEDFPDGFCCADCPMVEECDFQDCPYLDDF